MNLREKLTPDKFIELHIRKNLSLTEIGEIYGVSRQRIHQFKKEIEVKHGKINRRLFIDVFSLKHFLEQGWTAKQIGEYYDLKPSKVARLIRKYKSEYESGYSNIKIERKKIEDIISRDEIHELYIEKLYTDEEIAEKFNVSTSAINILRRQYNIKTNNNKSLRKEK